MNAQLADRMCELQDAQEKLKERERIHEQACRTIQKLMQKLSSQEKEIKRLNQQQKEQSVNKEVRVNAFFLSNHHYKTKSLRTTPPNRLLRPHQLADP